MAKTKTVRLGNRKRRYLNVVVPVAVPDIDGDGRLHMDEDGDPASRVEERTYRVPLMGSLRSGEMLLFYTPEGKEVGNLEALHAFHQLLCRYMPRDVVDELDMDDIGEFFDAWQEASEDDGVTQGE